MRTILVLAMGLLIIVLARERNRRISDATFLKIASNSVPSRWDYKFPAKEAPAGRISKQALTNDAEIAIYRHHCAIAGYLPVKGTPQVEKVLEILTTNGYGIEHLYNTCAALIIVKGIDQKLPNIKVSADELRRKGYTEAQIAESVRRINEFETKSRLRSLRTITGIEDPKTLEILAKFSEQYDLDAPRPADIEPEDGDPILTDKDWK